MRNLIITVIILALVPIYAFAQCGSCEPTKKASPAVCKATESTSTTVKAAPAVKPVALEGYGKKNWIQKDYYFTYEFTKKPKMGMCTIKIELFDKDGKKVNDLSISGNTDMPSMKGAHSSGDVEFAINKKTEAYLLPVNLVMPGEWQVDLKFFKDKKPIYAGYFKLTI